MVEVVDLFLGNLADVGFFELLLPWILFFTLLYIIFKKTSLFVEESQNITLSLAISLFIVNFTSFGLSFAVFLTQSFGIMAIGVVFILIAWIFCGIIGVDTISLVRDNKYIFFMIGVLFALSVSMHILGNYWNIEIGDTIITMFFILFMFGGIHYVTKS